MTILGIDDHGLISILVKITFVVYRFDNEHR